MQNAFPDVKGLINNLHDIGFKGVWMVDPGLKVEKGYEAYDTGSAEDVWIQNADGKPYVGRSFHPLQKKKIIPHELLWVSTSRICIRSGHQLILGLCF